MRKPRSDSKLDNLGEAHFMELRKGLLGSWSQDAALEWLMVECAVKSSAAALSGFFKKHCAPLLKERRRFAALKAEEMAKAEAENPIDWAAAGMDRISELFFEMALDPNVEIADVKRLGDLISKSKALELDSRKVGLLEAKARFADEVKKKAENREGGVTAEEMDEIERRLKLM